MSVTSIQVSGRAPAIQVAPARTAPRDLATSAPSLGDVAGMGIEALAALLTSETARANARFARDMQREAKASQADALDRQAGALREKASDMTSEAIVTGSLTAAGGALTIASAAAAPSPADASKSVQWENAATKYGGNFSTVSAQCKAVLEHQRTVSTTLSSLGQSTSSIAGSMGKGTYGAQQANDDADAARAAAEAKFAEASRDEFGALAREFEAGSSKALQVLQAMVVDRQSVRRGILQRM